MKDLMLKIVYSKYFLILLVVLMGVLSTYFLGDDNPIEEITEEIIKEETGIDIDFTPNSMKGHSKKFLYHSILNALAHVH